MGQGWPYLPRAAFCSWRLTNHSSGRAVLAVSSEHRSSAPGQVLALGLCDLGRPPVPLRLTFPPPNEGQRHWSLPL